MPVDTGSASSNDDSFGNRSLAVNKLRYAPDKASASADAFSFGDVKPLFMSDHHPTSVTAQQRKRKRERTRFNASIQPITISVSSTTACMKLPDEDVPE